MKNDRFLISILIGIFIIVLAAVILFFQRQTIQNYREDSIPEGVLHNYALALTEGDYQRAYDYLSTSINRPDFDTFRRGFLTRQLDLSNASLQTGSAEIIADEALVPVTVLQAGGGLFGDIYRMQYTAILIREEGAWKIKEMPYPYFHWDWIYPPEKWVEPPPARD